MTNLPTTARERSAEPNSGPGPGDRPLRWFFGVPFRARTYLNLLYVLLAVPLGLLYFVGVTVGVSLGLGLLVTLLGLPLLLLTLVAATILAGVDARLTAHLVGIEAPLPEPLRPENPRGLSRAEDGVLDALAALVTAPTTWTSLLLLVGKFCYGIAAFTVVVTAWSVVTALLAAPLVYADPAVTYTVGAYTVDTLPQALAASTVGVFGAFLSLHLVNGVATVGGSLTAALLEVPPSNADGDRT